LVFDRGNNSSANIEELVQKNSFSFHFVGGLKQNQCPEFLTIPKTDFSPLQGDSFRETTAFRTTKKEFGRDVTVVITNNPELYDLQMRGVTNNIGKCIQKLEELSGKLKEREDGKIHRGRRYTSDSVMSGIKKILSAEHMSFIFDCNVTVNKGHLKLNYQVSKEKFDYIKEHVLGKSILFTDRHDWTNEKIVSAYRAQYHVEECFKQMENNKFLSFVPIRHFKDDHIAVHAFYCVLALTLSSLLNLEFKRMGYNISINQMLKELNDFQQVISYYNIKDKIIKELYSLTEPTEKVHNYFIKYNLYKYSYK
jgi:transposase